MSRRSQRTAASNHLRSHHRRFLAGGNPQLAVEFLFSGLPDTPAPAPAQTPVAAPSATAPTGSATGVPLARLRNHPQFNQLRTLVQTNPAALQQVLQTIGAQDPDLLREINENQAAFLEIMNSEVPAATPTPAAAPPGGVGGWGGGMGMEPAQMMQMLNSMPPAQRAQMAQMIGLTPQQLEQATQMIGSM